MRSYVHHHKQKNGIRFEKNYEVAHIFS